MPFSKSSIAVRTADGKNCTVLEAFSFLSQDGEWYTIPIGFETDGISDPPEVWIIIPPFGAYWMCAVFHDYLYKNTQLPKEKCDLLFLEAMRSRCVPEAQALAIYEGVRLGGWKAFRDDRATQQPSAA